MKKVFTAIMVAAMMVMFSMPLMADNGNHYGQLKQAPPCGGFEKANSGLGNQGEKSTNTNGEEDPGGNDIDPGNSGQQSQGGKNDGQSQYDS